MFLEERRWLLYGEGILLKGLFYNGIQLPKRSFKKRPLTTICTHRDARRSHRIHKNISVRTINPKEPFTLFIFELHKDI